MRVLITGGAGFIGSHLDDRLSADGHEVTAIDNFETADWSRFHGSKLDIVNRSELYELANQVLPELVIHCAASYKDPDKWHRDVDTNVTGTINAVLVAKHHGAKLVYFQTALPPVSSYAISKIAGEHYIRLSGVPALVFRLANVYGPRNVSGPIPAFYKRLAAGERCAVSLTARDMVYIDDLLECVLMALNRGRTGRFDVCSGDQTQILSLYRAVAAHFEDAPEPDVSQPSGDDVPTAVSINACLPGWSATTPIPEGVSKAVAWYRENGVGETYTHLRIEEKHDERSEAAA